MSDVIKRRDAIALGLTKYFTGKSCKHGHIDQRYTGNRQCLSCNEDKYHIPANKAAKRKYAQSAHGKAVKKLRTSIPAFKQWQKEYNRQYHKDPKNKLAEFTRDLMSKYQLTLDQYEAMLNAQNNRCYICSVPFDLTRQDRKVSPCVDHDHSTGKVRELLCTMCNFVIGNCREDISNLEKSIQYLKQHKACYQEAQ